MLVCSLGWRQSASACWIIWSRWKLGTLPCNLRLILSSATFLRIPQLPLASIWGFKRLSNCSCVLKHWSSYWKQISVLCTMVVVGDLCARRAAKVREEPSWVSLLPYIIKVGSQCRCWHFLMAHPAHHLSTLWLALFLDLPVWYYCSAGWSGAPAADDSGGW